MSKNYPHNNDLPYSDENVGNIDDFDETIGDVPELSDEQKQQFDNRYGKRSWWQRIKRTIQGKNEVGEYVGLGFDIGESLLPRWVSRIRDIIQSKIQRKQHTTMSYPKEKLFDKIKRFIKQKSTQTAIVSLFAILGLVFGIDVDPQVFTETLLGIVTGASAIVASAYNIYQMFQDEDKPKTG